ncbi:hypothetical protein [Microcystis phage Mae-JY22]
MTFWKLTRAGGLQTLLAAIGIGVAIYYGWKQTLDRSLEVAIVSQTELLPSSSPGLKAAQLSIDGASVHEPYLTVIMVSNNGDEAIRAAEFETPLVLKLNGPARLVRADVSTTEPDNVRINVTRQDDQAVIAPTLLNPGDTIRLSLLTGGGVPKFSPDARIAGISRVQILGIGEHPVVRSAGTFIIIASLIGIWCGTNLMKHVLDSWLFGGKPNYRLSARQSLAVIFMACGSVWCAIIAVDAAERFGFPGITSEWWYWALGALVSLFASSNLAPERKP